MAVPLEEAPLHVHHDFISRVLPAIHYLLANLVEE